jgi:hypothetical protein
MTVARRRLRTLGATLAAYVAVVVVLTWPLASALGTHLPRAAGAFVSDLYYATWALAWQTHALTTSPMRFADANIYGGVPLALFYGTPGFGLLPIFAPIFALSGNPTLAINGTLLLSLASTATAVHVVVESWTRSRLAGIAAASTFLTTRAALLQCVVMPQYAALAAMPAIVWMLARESVSRRGAILLAALLALQALTDVVYVAVPLFVTVGLTAAVRLAAGRKDGARIALALVAAGLVLVPVYSGYLAVRSANPNLARQTVWLVRRDPQVGLLGLPAGTAPLAVGALTYLPALAGAWLRAAGRADRSPALSRAWGQAALWFGVSLAMSWVLPLLVPGLRDLLRATMARDVVRLGFTGLVGLSLLAGLGFAACVEAVTQRAAGSGRTMAVMLLAVWLATRLWESPRRPGDYPIAPAPAAGPEAAILRAGTGTVLELPVGDPRRDTGSHAAAMYRSTAHWRTLVNGYSSYQPQGFQDRIDLVRTLPSHFALDALRTQTGLTSIVVHAAGMPALTIGRWRRAVEEGGLRDVRIDYVDDEVLVLAVLPPQ